MLNLKWEGWGDLWATDVVEVLYMECFSHTATSSVQVEEDPRGWNILCFWLLLSLLLENSVPPIQFTFIYLITAAWKHTLLLILHIQQYSELPSAYFLEENHYWLPAATLSGIKAQMHQKAAHSLELQPESIILLEELGKREFGMVYKGSRQALPREYCRWLWRPSTVRRRRIE